MRKHALNTLCSGVVTPGAALLLCACASLPDPLPEANQAHVVDTAATTATAQREAHDAPQWVQVWVDEFDGDALDRSRWSPEEACWGGGNNERQCYTDRPDNIRVADGLLHLMAKPEVFTGPLYSDARPDRGTETRRQEYTSGKVRTRGLASWRYGRFSARLKLPAGQGAWPAFWMMPAQSVYGRWPLSGELDIMEAVNLAEPCADCPGGEEQRTSAALHFGDTAPDNTYLFAHADGTRRPGPSEEWRVYSVEWAEGVIQWFVDGEMFFRLESDDWNTVAPNAAGRAHAPFDEPFYLILNLAVGGNLPERSNGAGFDPASFPAALLVDWVRVEQCAGDEDTGRACLSDKTWTGTPKGPWEVQAR